MLTVETRQQLCYAYLAYSRRLLGSHICRPTAWILMTSVALFEVCRQHPWPALTLQ